MTRSYKSIPTEILWDIFDLLCEGPIALHVLENRSCFDKFPWAVGQVCRHWRGSFLSYARPWTSLSLEYATRDGLPEADIDRFNEINRRTVLCLKRSRQLPLHIIVSFQHSSSRPNRSIPSAAWKSLLSCSDRWKSLHLCTRCVVGVIDGLLDCRGKFSALESLTLNTFDFKYPNGLLESAFAVAPRLTDLEIVLYRNDTPWVFPWSQLKKLTIRADNRDRSRNVNLELVLSQIKNVEELKITFNSPADNFVFRPSDPIQLPSVRFLEATMANYPYIFKWFKIPVLEHLWVSAFGGDDLGRYRNEQLWHAEIRLFLSRSSCRIRHLTLESCRNELELILVEELASVEHLCIRGRFSKATPMLVRHIANSNDGVRLPNLQDLHVMLHCLGQADEEFMAAMTCLLEARGNESRSALSGHKFVPLQRMTVEWGLIAWWCICGKQCRDMNEESKDRILDKMVKTMHGWSSIADISIEECRSQNYVRLYLQKR